MTKDQIQGTVAFKGLKKRKRKNNIYMCYSKKPSFILELAWSMVISFLSFQEHALEGLGI